MSGADLHAMAKARTALLEAKNELIRCGCGSDLTLLMLRDAEAALARQIKAHVDADLSAQIETSAKTT